MFPTPNHHWVSYHQNLKIALVGIIDIIKKATFTSPIGKSRSPISQGFKVL